MTGRGAPEKNQGKICGLAVGLEALANYFDRIRGHCWTHGTGVRETNRLTKQTHYQTLGLQLARQVHARVKHA